ncbi:hypothetical protein A9R05_06880 [Burkholderia sp. KK1]|nr:hypothetical protein A9R05_06880 [Burkholderia sp. KK1]
MIRNATQEDVPVLVDLGRHMTAESPRYKRLTYAPAKLERLFRTLVDSPDGFVMIAEQDGVPIGGMVGMVVDHWMAEERMASDLCLYVLPEYRGGMTAVRFVRRYIEFAQARGAADISLGVSTGSAQIEKLARFFEMLGLQKAGYLFEVPHV